MDSNKTSVLLWPIFTFTGLLLFKDHLLDEYSIQLYFNLATDCLLVMIMFVLSIKRRSALLQWMQSIIAVFIISYHWLDSCIYIAIQNRLTLNNVIGNIKYFNVFIYFISPKIVVLTLAVIIVPIILRKRTVNLPIIPSTTNFISYEAVFALVIAYFIIGSKSSPYNEGNAVNLSTNSYSALSVTADTLNYVKSNFAPLIQRISDYFNGIMWGSATQVNDSRPNIIIVLSESLSMVDSKYAGGLFNRLPMIDKLQEDGMVFTHAVSNGKITPHGLAAFILGIQTTKTGGYIGMLEQFTPGKFRGNNIVTYAKKAGYQTIVISPGQPPNFYQMIPWFKSTGFDQIYDMDSDIFAAAPRFTWHAPSDQAMYEAALNMLPNLKQPYFLVIETVSLHQPYILPDIKYRIGSNDLLNQINYVDGTTYDFYQALKKTPFFKNGFFLIFGDHRRFEPLEKPELDDGGYSVWHERIVCSIVGKGIPPHSVANLPFSLVDMNALLHNIIDGDPVNDKTVLQANLGNVLGIDMPFNISLVDDDHGTYLIRSDKAPPLYISIYGKLPFKQIPNPAYTDATVYLIENDQQMLSKIAAPNQQGNKSW
jgi:phosphoglycerol transferase MdoB-like AlkP superfamily enzyme